ncbi:unnamed protein product [Linum tenue]|uniref:GDSL esterase/lipase n=1 Tax=Linum tenue TaxID=586396 RepID=A0AAV0M937_9ROSI|nr:unnamed protein product [Linum tenue]
MSASVQLPPLPLLLITTIITALFSSTTAAAAAPTRYHPFKKIYAFGDSFTDTGNTRPPSGGGFFGHVSSPPYGSTYFHRPTNRYSDGRLVIDFVAQSLSLPLLPPYRSLRGARNNGGGANFAVGGATAIKHAFFVKNNLTLDNTPVSIQTQLQWFDESLRSQGCDGNTSTAATAACAAAVEDALFWVGEIGVNDYAYTLGSEVSGKTIRRLSIATVTNFLEGLLKRGAKKMVVQGLPPAGCLTLAMYLSPDDDRDELGCVKTVNNQAQVHNSVYRSKLNGLRARYPKASIVYLDYWSAYRAVVRSPGKYRMKEKFKACCGSGDPPYNFNVFATCGSPGASAAAAACPDPSRYVNWDGVHLTEGMYRVLADLFVNGSFSTPRFATLLA